MTTRSAEAPGLPELQEPPEPPLRCMHGGNNGTCAEQLRLLPPFSSALALLVLVAVLAGVVLVSLATFHFHKRKLRNRKILRAQEEYERDSRDGRAAARSAGPARPSVIARPVRREERAERPSPSAESGDVEAEDAQAQTAPLDC
ncbi:uncharacterized protein C11orf87 homolog [Cololabis saira]|uniref:uncharacterized protein C11orf87 homolog n=1 Tax=Cololabis saira TaxID=129043 RepID=UPI002AD43FC6|nr:uncharacterized protein C11orf87 homolog [Cololabis saira]